MGSRCLLRSRKLLCAEDYQTMRIRTFLLASVLAASSLTMACRGSTDSVAAPTPVESPGAKGSSPVPGKCDATKAQFSIGERASRELLERARVRAQARSARFVRPNEPITMEFLKSRLSLTLDARDVVGSADCR